MLLEKTQVACQTLPGGFYVCPCLIEGKRQSVKLLADLHRLVPVGWRCLIKESTGGEHTCSAEQEERTLFRSKGVHDERMRYAKVA